MWTLLITVLLAANATQNLDSARDRQDRVALQKTVEEFAAAAAKAPNDAAAQYGLALSSSYLAEVAQELHDRKQARAAAERGIAAAEKLVGLKPDAESYRVLGVLYGQAITDWLSGLSYGPRAKSAIDKAVSKAPGSAAVYVARGVGNFYLPAQLGGGSAVAIADFRKATQLEPGNAEAYVWLGVALSKEDKAAEARQALEKALKLDPQRIWAKQLLEKLPAK